MSIFDLFFIFAVGMFAGWVLEIFYRTFISQKKLVNPGFLSGPYLPLYGFGVTFLYLVSVPVISLPLRILLFLVITTLIEYLTGEFFLKVYRIRLWDYSSQKFNYRGLICPLFSIYWTLLSLLFYFFIFPRLTVMVSRTLGSPPSYWALGVYYGLFFEDMLMSFDLASRLQHIIAEFAESEGQRLKVKIKELPLDRKTVDFKIFKHQVRRFGSRLTGITGFFRFFNPFMNSLNVDVRESVARYFNGIEKVRGKIKRRRNE